MRLSTALYRHTYQYPLLKKSRGQTVYFLSLARSSPQRKMEAGKSEREKEMNGVLWNFSYSDRPKRNKGGGGGNETEPGGGGRVNQSVLFEWIGGKQNEETKRKICLCMTWKGK